MPYAVELYFDRAAEAAVRALWAAIGRAGVPSPLPASGARPHVSLAVYEDGADEAALETALRAYAPTLAPLELTLVYLGFFPTAEGVAFLGVTATRALLEEHGRCLRALADAGATLRQLYAAGSWVPHCTLTFGLTPEAGAAIVPLGRSAALPWRARVEATGLTRVTPAGGVSIAEFGLRSAE